MLLTALFSGGGILLTVAGIWIASMFVPSVALVVKSALDFFRSPIGEVIAIIAAVMFVFTSAWVGGDIHGTEATKAAWKADVAKQALAAAAREDALRTQMKALADASVSADGTFGKIIDNKVSNYVQTSPKRPECRATHDDIGRLLSIR